MSLLLLERCSCTFILPLIKLEGVSLEEEMYVFNSLWVSEYIEQFLGSIEMKRTDEL